MFCMETMYSSHYMYQSKVYLKTKNLMFNNNQVTIIIK